MKSKVLWWVLGGLGIFFILSSLTIAIVEYNRFTNITATFPPGSQIAGIPVGGLNQQDAEARLREFFSLPLVLTIHQATIHANPEDLGFTVDVTEMAEEAVAQMEMDSYWSHLWGGTTQTAVDIPLSAEIDESRILTYLNTEILPRYIEVGSPETPIPLTTNFAINLHTQLLDSEQAISDIHTALLTPEIHRVTLEVKTSTQDSASLPTLEAFLKHNINWIGFNDLVEVYLESMDTHQTLHFAIQNGAAIIPDVAFTAASTIKIPIMISVLRRTDEPTPENAVVLLERSIVFSENPPTDTLMKTYLDEVRGPLIVSEDLAELGMKNTFLAGFFYLGAPVLQLFETPANTRTDIFLDPDIYNQTVPSETGQLLSAIYTCAKDGSGLLTETFPGEITQSECQLMVEILSANRIGLLIEASLPPETKVAHKHGWVQELDGLLHSMSDVAIVFTPGGDYVLNIFIYDPVRLDFDEGNRLIARLSQTVYNFFNLDHQAYWWFE